MEDLIRSWMTRIVSAALVLTAVYLLAPKGRLRAAVRFTGGLVLIAALLGPLAGVELTGDLSFGDCAADVERRAEAMQRSYAEQEAALIAERTAAYISDKNQQQKLKARSLCGFCFYTFNEIERPRKAETYKH